MLLEIWLEILENTFALSNYLQSKSMDVTQASNMIQSTLAYVKKFRTDEAFNLKLSKAKVFAESEDSETAFQVPRVRRHRRMAGETAADEPTVNAETRFKNNVYFAIYDRLIVEFQDRFSDFENSVKKFSCLLPKHLGEISHFRQLANIYSKDVDIDSAVAEYSQFSSLANETKK